MPSTTEKVELQLGLDLKSLDQDTKKGEEYIKRLTLGNSGGGAAPGGVKTPISQFADEMEKLIALSSELLKSQNSIIATMREQVSLREKELQFSKETKKLDDTGGGPARGPDGRFLKKPPPEGFMASLGQAMGGSSAAVQVLSAIASAGSIQQLTMLGLDRYNRGGDWAKWAGNIAGSVPVVGGIIAHPFNLVAGMADQQDKIRELRYDTFRDSGEAARRQLTDLQDYTHGRGLMDRYGINHEELASLVNGAYKSYGSFNESTIAIQGRYGLGNEFSGMLGALRRGGMTSASGQGENIFAETIGSAIATGLERGRWGEMVQMVTHAASAITMGTVNQQRILEEQRFVGGLGPQFQGATPAAQAMDQMLQQMAKGQGSGLTNIMAMQEAGLGSGTKFWAARSAVQAGLNTNEGLSLRQTVHIIARQDLAKRFLAGKIDVDDAAGPLSMVLGQPQNLIKAVLIGLKNGGGGDLALDPKLLDAVIQEMRSGQMPDTDLVPRRQQVAESRSATRGFDQQRDVSTVDTTPRTGASPNDLKTMILNSSHVDASIQTGPTMQQTQEFKSSAQFRNTPDYSSRFVDSMGEANAQWASRVGHGMYRVMDYKGQKIYHGARDIFMPAGSPVYTPKAGKFIRSALDTSGTTYGYFAELLGDDGVLYRFIHLERQSRLVPKQNYPAGTLVGYTVRHTVGQEKSASHLHFEAWRGFGNDPANFRSGTKIDPFTNLDVGDINDLYTGFRSREDWQRAGAPPPPVLDDNSPSAQNVKVDHEHRVRIDVHDSRVKTRVTSTRSRSSASGQNFTKKTKK